MKSSVLVVCTIINVLVTIIALIFVFKVDVAWTGSLGDTFGGLLSPIIGLISIYFIYKTFAAQRNQLEDQIRATNFSGSSLYFNEVNSMIVDVKVKFDAINYGEYIDEKIGEEAIKAIKHDLSGHNLSDSFFKDAWPLLLSLNEQTRRILLVATVGNSIKDENLKRLFEDKFRSQLYTVLQQITSVFKDIRRSLKLMQDNEEYRTTNSKYVSLMASQYEFYLKSITALTEVVSFVNQVKIIEADKVHIKKISVEERLSKLDLTNDWSIV